MMRLYGTLFTCLVLLSCGTIASAAEELPRVLFLGDQVHRQMIDAAARELKDRVKIEFPRIDAADSGTALAHIDELLGDAKWDLIYFNFGIGDLLYKDPRTREIRAMAKSAGGVRVASPAQYEANLDKLVTRLKATGAKLIWASTTPMVDLKNFADLYDEDSEVEYNRIAARVMTKKGVPINDMHAYVLEQIKDGKHPSFLEYNRTLPLHEAVTQSILKQVGPEP